MTRLRRQNSAFAMMLIMIVLIIATAIGLWALTTSRSSMTKAGSRKFSAELTYQSEQGLQKAVRRIQSIAAGNPDVVAQANSAADKNLAFLTNTICTGDATTKIPCSGAINTSCKDFDTTKDFDVPNENVICNFLGIYDKSTQVSIVRKQDLDTGSGATTKHYAIYLVNSIAKDSSDRKQGIQGVVVVPYAAGETPHLATSKAIVE